MAGYDYDVLIIGGGPGGYVAGIRAAQLGLKAAVVERDKVGGVCLNVGCIPSKALIHQAELFRSIPSLKELGLAVDTKGFDYKNVFDKSRKAADTLVKGVQFLLKKNKVETIAGEGALSGKNEVTLKDGKKVTGKNIVIATGSRPRVIPGFEFDEQKVLSSTGRHHALPFAKESDHPRGGRHRRGVQPRFQRLRRGSPPGRDAGPHPAHRGCRGRAGAGPRVPEAGRPDVHGDESCLHGERRKRRQGGPGGQGRRQKDSGGGPDPRCRRPHPQHGRHRPGESRDHHGKGIHPGGGFQPDEGARESTPSGTS